MAHAPEDGGEIKPVRGLERISQPPPAHTGRRMARGAAAGAAVGGAIAAGGLFVPFVWPILLVTAPLAVVIGAGAGAAIEGMAERHMPIGEVRTLEDFDIPDPEIAHYRDALANGHFFVAVRTSNHEKAMHTLKVYEDAGCGNIHLFRPGQPQEV